MTFNDLFHSISLSLSLSLSNYSLITEDRMPRNTFLYENIMFTNRVNAASLWVGKEKLEGKELVLIKRVKLTQQFEEVCGVAFKLVHVDLKKLELIF